MLNECEVQIRSDQKKLLKSNDLIEELKNREQSLQRSEGSAIGSNLELKERYKEQKDEIRRLHHLLEDAEANSRAQLQSLTYENGQFRAELEASRGREMSLKEKLNGKFQGIDSLEQELTMKENLIRRFEVEKAEKDTQLRILKDEVEKGKIEKEKLEQRLEENNRDRKDFELELGKYQRKTEEDIKTLIQERDNERATRKEKLKRLKDEIKEQEKMLNKANEDKKYLEIELEKLIGQKTQSERDMYKTRDELKAANKEM